MLHKRTHFTSLSFNQQRKIYQVVSVETKPCSSSNVTNLLDDKVQIKNRIKNIWPLNTFIAEKLA